MTRQVITSLEVLFTANTQQVDKASKDVRDQAQKIERNPVKQKIDGDAKGALDSMDRVEAEAKKLVSAKTVATVEANIAKAETSLATVRDRLDYLRSIEASMEVTADIKKAESALKQIERRRDGLVSARESMVIDADTKPAKAALDDIADEAGDAGAKGGDDAGEGLAGGIIAAIATIPIAGAVVGIGAAIGKSLLDGLQVEVRSDRLMATTGLDAATVGKLARAAGEAYASNWGESIEANMDAARVAVQQGLLDPKGTARASEQVISSLSGVADMLGGDIPRVSQAAATIMRTGLAKDAAGAFDIIVRGMQLGNDKAEDWLDTLIEYPSVLTKLGLTGEEMTGLIAQGLAAGARNSDVAADALKEFQIRATDASTASTEAYQLIGLNAEEMTAKIAAGGEGAREGLDIVLDRLRSMEDPVARNAAAVGLFGTKAEDLGDALFAMDLSTVADEFGQVEGAAAKALGVLSDNAAGSIATAQRNIEVASDGIKGALAAAFNPQIEDFATWVSSNREQVMQFLLDIANGGLDAGRSFVEFTATGAEAIGGFIAGPMASLVDGIGGLLDGLERIPGIDLDGAAGSMHDLAEGMRGADDTAGIFADNLRENLIENGIDPAQAKLNEIGVPLVAQARLHDATVQIAAGIDSIGYAADGSAAPLVDLSEAVLRSTDAGRLLDDQISAVVASMEKQTAAGLAVGDSQEDITARLYATRDALIAQLVQMGYTQTQAEGLVTAYGAIPESILTTIAAETETAQANVDAFLARNQGKVIRLTAEVSTSGNAVYRTAAGTKFEGFGHVLTPMAAGGIPGSRMDPVAQMVPPNTWRVVGDRMDVDELYAPLDGSARSHALMAEGARRMGAAYYPLADGALLGSSTSPQVVSLAGATVVIEIDGQQMRGYVREVSHGEALSVVRGAR